MGVFMKDILDEIDVLPGVVGSCVFSKERGQICSGLPPSFTDDAVLAIANRVLRLVQMGGIVDMDVQTISLRFDIYTIMAMPVDSETLLLIACESRSNCSLITTTISMLAGELQGRLAKEFTPSPDIKEIADKSDDGQEAVRTASLLKQVRGALAFVVGPMADMVFDDNVALWTQNKTAGLSRLPELIEMVANEIGDDSAAEFKEKVNMILAKNRLKSHVT
jgi:predicted regulator of Ras-like GTPase activity (Roadblock/LC7/MglB family)